MKGFILAAGYGERCRPITAGMPKALMPVCNIPAICYSLMLLKEAGISDVIINLHYLPGQVTGFFLKHGNFGMNLTFSLEERILGTGGGIKNCERYLRDDEFVLINSDVVSDLRLEELIAYHRSMSSPATVVLARADGRFGEGEVGVDGPRVVDFRNFLNTGRSSPFLYAGIAVLAPAVLDHLSAEFSSVVYTGYVELVKRNSLFFYEHGGIWLDIGSLDSYWNANMLVAKNTTCFESRMHGACGMPLEPVAGGAAIGENASITDSIIGDGCVIGDNAVIERSVLLPGARVSRNARIQNAIVYMNKTLSV